MLLLAHGVARLARLNPAPPPPPPACNHDALVVCAVSETKLVLMAMMTYGAVIWRRRILQRKREGVDDFCE